MNGDLVVISLTPQEAAMFTEFRRSQDVFMTLLKVGVFDIKGGNVTLHFDADGALRQIDRKDTLLRT